MPRPKSPRKTASPAQPTPPRPDTPIAQLSGLGPKSASWLNAVGIFTWSDLKTIGLLPAYFLLLDSGISPNRNLLYSLYSALHSIHWTAVTPAIKAQLDRQAARKSSTASPVKRTPHPASRSTRR